MALEALGDTSSALEAYGRAETEFPNDPRAPNNRGAALAKTGNTLEAEAAYAEAVSRDPTYARAHHNLGDLYASMGRASEAVESYERFLKSWTGAPEFLDLARRKIDSVRSRENQ